MKKLCDLVEIEENNMECVLLKVKDNSMLDLIKLGCFEGNEKLIRITKGRDHTITIFTDKDNYSWYYGESGYTIVSKSMDAKRNLISDCIENDFNIYIGKDKKLVEKSLDIHSLKDTYNKSDFIEIMYCNGQDENNVVVHKNGDFFRTFNGIIDAKNYFKNSNYLLNFTNKYIAKTGCIVEEYTMKRKEYSNEKKSDLESKEDSDIDYDYE